MTSTQNREHSHAAPAAETRQTAAVLPETPKASKPVRIVLGEPFQLAIGQEGRLKSEDLVIRFEKVVADSRCPRDVTCVWEGDAEIQIRALRGESEQEILRLHTAGGEPYPREAEVFGHVLALEALDPWPETAGGIEPEEYLATLVLR